MINIENRYFLLLIPLVILLFILDKSKKTQYVYKLSLFKILQDRFLYTSLYLDKIFLYSILFCLILILTGISVTTTIKNEAIIVFNVPYINGKVLKESKDILERYAREFSAFEVYANNHYIGRYSLGGLEENLFKKDGIFDNFYVETIGVDNKSGNAKIFMIKFCDISYIKINGNVHNVCIKGLDNIGIIKKAAERIFLFNYYESDRKVSVKIGNDIEEISLPASKVTDIKVDQNVGNIQIINSDEFVSDNHFVYEPLRIYVSDGLTYTTKSLVALGYILVPSELYDLCIYKTYIQTNRSCRYIWLLASARSDLYNLTNLENKGNLLLSNLNVPSNFDINKVVFKNIFRIDFKRYNKMIAFVTTNKGDIIMGFYEVARQQYIVTGFDWEEAKQTDFAYNVESPLPIFIESVLRYIFPERYSAENAYIGEKLFSYYNGDFPTIKYKNKILQPLSLALNPVFEYIGLILFIFYILFSIIR